MFQKTPHIFYEFFCTVKLCYLIYHIQVVNKNILSWQHCLVGCVFESDLCSKATLFLVNFMPVPVYKLARKSKNITFKKKKPSTGFCQLALFEMCFGFNEELPD